MHYKDLIGQVSAIAVWTLICLSNFVLVGAAAATPIDAHASDETQLLAEYEAAMARGDEAGAVKHALEFSEKAHGKYDPRTVKLTHRYGFVLYMDREYREATGVLKEALKRSMKAHGAAGGEAFDINMIIGYSLSHWSPNLTERMKYFDRALEILRDRGDHESLSYVATLIDIVVNLMDNNGLSGDVSTSIFEYPMTDDELDPVFELHEEYYSNYAKAKRYVRDAIEIASRLETQDEFITAKVAVAQAKLNVMETVDLRNVPLGVQGGITRKKARNRNDIEADRLMEAIGKLSKDADSNSIFLTAANRSLMDIAWLDEDKSRMDAMCSNGTLNSAGDYHADRLYRVEEDGSVIAPNFGFAISTNIFEPLRLRGEPPTDRYGNLVKQPSFIPVCINGQLMALLVNAPRVIIEELQ